MNDTTDSFDRSTLFAKLAQVTAAVAHIPKNGYNSHFQYKFATDADVSAALSKELSERKVQTFVSGGDVTTEHYTKDNGKSTILSHVLVTVTFACGDTGATFSVSMPGSGTDQEDKGTYKAITGAVKYALLKTFLVATGDDPEQVAEASAARDAAFAGTPVVAAKVDAGVSAIAATFDATPVTAADTDAANEYVFSFGKNKGIALSAVDASYLEWLLKQPAKDGYEAKHAKDAAMYQAELNRRAA
jgi:hypothetical protein